METYYTSDLHFGHRLVSEIRGFSTVEEHDSAVLTSLLSVVKPGDRLVNLGDNSIEGTWEHGLKWMDALGVEVHLIIGNHDRVFPQKRDSAKFFRAYAQVFSSIQLFQRDKLDGKSFLLSHMPYWPNDRGEARLRQWRPVNEGLPLVHGHTHSDVVEEWDNHFHVGWDAWKRPVSRGELLDWMRTRG